MGVAESWGRITEWYRRNVEELTLASGASEEQIAALEAVIGARLPEDVRASYLLHNGTAGSRSLLHHGDVLSLDRIERTWRRYGEWQREDGWNAEEPETTRPEGAIKPYLWGPLRIPLTDNCGNHDFLDLDPDSAGVLGQMLKYDHERPDLAVEAASWSEFLEELADGLESGKYRYYPDAGSVGPPGLWD